ncbi:MAG: tyrosine--tRNA ligase [Bacteroidales bacterium]|jgi:tyrosyl-tRNA synthetase|nr:tyrosine--tRNA ligase [Bacteroidales bacterium]
MNFVDELTWRGMIHDIMPGAKELMDKETIAGYVGFDPTAESLHIGHLVGVMMLKHFQMAGHKPIALIGGATGMIGDPSMKSAERNLLDEPTLRRFQEGIRRQLSKFLDFGSNAPNAAELVNNYDWMKDFSFLDFIRDIGKHITVNYMMSKDSVKKRLNEESRAGLSFTEFSYQLVQGNDFLHLYRTRNCKLQMGGSDQWGNITTGAELIRRKESGEAFALTCPLITKADGTKFGKTESGNVWLDPKLTSPYKFYQFWLNTSDADAEGYIKIFTMLPKDDIEQLTARHRAAPHLRELQRKLAEELTVMVHSRADCDMAITASQILFGAGTADSLRQLNEDTFLQVFEGVEQYSIPRTALEAGVSVSELLATTAPVFPSKGELKRAIQGNSLSINKEKISNFEHAINTSVLLNDKYILVTKGKRNNILLIAE